MANNYTIGVLSGGDGTLIGKDYTTDIADINTSLADMTSSIDSLTTEITAIKSSLAAISTNIGSFVNRAANEDLGNYVNSVNLGNLTDAQQRALQIVALKESGLLDDIILEINSPTTLPGD